MENYNIETYYKNIDKPVIDNYANNLNLKNLLALSTITDLYLFTKKKKKNEWKLKDKRKLLKECDIKRKKTIKEVSTSLNVLSKNKSTNLVKEIKIKNNTLLNRIENLDSIIETIENIYPTISDEYIEIYSN
jgi:tRNA(Met) C34 N-acetyltransferase TmcA